MRDRFAVLFCPHICDRVREPRQNPQPHNKARQGAPIAGGRRRARHALPRACARPAGLSHPRGTTRCRACRPACRRSRCRSRSGAGSPTANASRSPARARRRPVSLLQEPARPCEPCGQPAARSPYSQPRSHRRAPSSPAAPTEEPQADGASAPRPCLTVGGMAPSRTASCRTRSIDMQGSGRVREPCCIEGGDMPHTPDPETPDSAHEEEPWLGSDEVAKPWPVRKDWLSGVARRTDVRIRKFGGKSRGTWGRSRPSTTSTQGTCAGPRQPSPGDTSTSRQTGAPTLPTVGGRSSGAC